MTNTSIGYSHVAPEDDDDWGDISACVPTYTKRNGVVSTELQMAGGGAHAWWYVLEWKNEECQPDIFIIRIMPEKKTPCRLETLIIRTEMCGCQSVKLVDFDIDLPPDNGEYFYNRWELGDKYDEVDEEYDDDDEEEEEEEEDSIFN